MYLSGVVGLDKTTNKLVTGGIKEETELVFQHIKNILEECGSSLEKGKSRMIFYLIELKKSMYLFHSLCLQIRVTESFGMKMTSYIYN